MKKQLLFTLFSVLMFTAAHAQKTIYSAISNKPLNPNFNSNTNNWNIGNWTRNNAAQVIYASGAAQSITYLYQDVTSINYNWGRLVLEFDVKLYKGTVTVRNSNPPRDTTRLNDTINLSVDFAGTNYLNFKRATLGEADIQITAANGAYYEYVTTAANNTNDYTSGFMRIRLFIPRSQTSGTTSGSTGANNSRLRFGYRSTNGGAVSIGVGNNAYTIPASFVALDNIQFYTESTVQPYSNSCTNCIPLTVTNGDIAYNDAPPTPECGQVEGNRQYVYYLPAVAELPRTIITSQSNPPSQIIILSEMARANVVIRRPESNTPLMSVAINKDSVYKYSTTLSDMVASSYNAGYTGKGYVIESDQPILVRWSLNHMYNWESVVLRGDNAKGKAFRAASVLYATRDSSTLAAEGLHYITVMATEANTKVQIANSDTATAANSFTIVTLSKGQQYTVVSTNKSVSGRLILADKPIVVSSGQQHKRIMGGGNGFTTSTSLEGTVIQLQPTYTLGQAYLIIATEGYDGFQVVAIQDSTVVRKAGTVVAVLRAGQSYQQYNKTADPSGLYGRGSYYVTTSKPAYVYNLGANSIGEFEMLPAPAADLPVGKSGKVVFDSTQGKSGWVVVNSVDTSKLRRNNSSNLGYSYKTVMASPQSGIPSKTIYYWDSTFVPNPSNDITCTGCDGMYVGQLADGGTGGAQVGYISSFDGKPLQFFNTKFLPTELLTNGYVFDSLNYGIADPITVTHKLTIASSNGNVRIDSVVLKRSGGHPDTGYVMLIDNTPGDLGFTLKTPTDTSAHAGMVDTIYTTVYLQDDANNVAALCLSYLITNIEALPVKLVSFEAQKVQESALLTWTTASEYNNKGYEVERSHNGVQWTRIGWVPSLTENGNTNNILKYYFTDNEPLSGINYYRLKQVDVVGKFEYTNVRQLLFESNKQPIRVYPNPAQNVIHLEGLLGNEKIKVYNYAGQLVMDKSINSTNVDLPIAHLPSGLYQIQLWQSGQPITTVKVVKE